jgi:hypothetical protein
VGFRPQLVVVSAFSVVIPLAVGFRPQLVVVSGLSVGIPLAVGFRPSGAFDYHGAPSQNFLSHDVISAITEPFHKLFFHMMEFWLSRSLSRTFLSHNGILAITEPFTNFSFTRWNFGYHGAFHELFLSHDGTLAIMESFMNFHDLFLTVEFTRHMIWGKTLFIYITKSIYIGSASLKTLPLDLEPPLQVKEYDPSYSKVITEKVNVFVSETTYRLVIQIFAF